MSNKYDDDVHFPSMDTEFPVVREEIPPSEVQVPKEEAYSFDEFNQNVVIKETEENRHSIKRLSFLKPVLALVTVLAVILPSCGINPLEAFGFSYKVSSPETVYADTSAETDDGETKETDKVSTDTAESTEDTEEPAPPEEEDEFPVLGNLDPDFAGDYAWSGDGPEEYIWFSNADEPETQYIVRGDAWLIHDPGVLVETPAAVYDESRNTLVLNGFNADFLSANLMGNGFTVELHGDNHIGGMSVWGAGYGGSVKFTGDGSLTVDNGIIFYCESSESCIMIAKGVTLDISGEPAVGIDSTLMEGSAIYVSKYLTVSGGTASRFGESLTDEDGNTIYAYTFIDDSGNPSTHVHIEPIEH